MKNELADLLSECNQRPRISVLRALQLGDMLCAVPAVRALRSSFPRAEITLIGLPWSEQLLQRYPRYFDSFIDFPGLPGFPEQEPRLERFPAFLAAVQQRKFDLVLQLHGSGRRINHLLPLCNARRYAGFRDGADGYAPDSALFRDYPDSGSEIARLLSLVSFLEIEKDGEQLEFPISLQERRAADELLAQCALLERPFICIHPGSRAADRRWRHDGFAAAADRLAASGLAVVFTGTGAERDLIEVIQGRMRRPSLSIAGTTELGVLGAVLCRARGLVCNDTGVSHLAAALRVPSIVVFTGSDPARWAPADSRRHRAVSGLGEMEEVLAAVNQFIAQDITRAA